MNKIEVILKIVTVMSNSTDFVIIVQYGATSNFIWCSFMTVFELFSAYDEIKYRYKNKDKNIHVFH